MSGSMLSPRSSHRLGSAALRRSSPGYVGSRRQVAPLSLDIIEQDAESLAAAALKREWLAIRRKEHQESLRRRSCLASPRNPSLLISEVEDSFSGPPQPPLPSRDQWLATNSQTRSGSETRGARRDSRRGVTEARAMHALRQPVKAVPDRSLHPSSDDLERKAKHQWLAQTRTAWESQRGQSARARSGSCLHPLLYRLALGARAALWAVKRAIAAWTPKLGCGGALVPGNSRRPPISLPFAFQESQLQLQRRHLLDDSPQQTPEQERALLSGVLQGWCDLSPCTPAADGSQACWST